MIDRRPEPRSTRKAAADRGRRRSASRRVAAALACLTALAVSAAAAGEPDGGGQALRSAAELDYPPFSLVDDAGAAGGFSVELMRAALAAMGRDVSFRTGPWNEVRGWLERGEVDALPLVGRTPEREGLFDFTVPYMTLHGAIVVRQDELAIRDLNDLKGRRVAVMAGDNAEEFLRRQALEIDIRTTPTFEVAFRELADGLHDAVIVQRLVALRLIQETGLTDLRVVEQPVAGFVQDFCFAVHEGDRDTLALLNEGLAIVMADGAFRRLHAEWFAAMQLPPDRPIVIGGDRNFPPFEFLDEHGRPAGFNVDLTRAIARELGLNVEIRLGLWSERLDALHDGRVDALQGMFYSPDRDLAFDFTQPHTVSHHVAVVRRGERPAPRSVEELGQLDIVVERGEILHDFVVANGLEQRATAVDDQEQALRQLAGGRHDCALVSRITALYLIERNGWTDLVPDETPLLSSEYCYAVAAGQRALLAELGEGLKAVEHSGDYRRIYGKWLGVYPEPGSTLIRALRASAVVIVPLLLVLGAAFAWSWTLRRQVAQRTCELEDSLDRFQHVFEAANVGKSITLPTGEIDANQAYADFLGYTLDELEGKTWRDLTPAEDIEASERAIAPLLSGETDAARFEKRYLTKDGSEVWADVSASIRRDAAGKPLHFLTTVVDVTDHVATRRRTEHLNRVLRGIRDVNQLIVRERDPERLIAAGCRLLVASRGYLSALIVLTDDDDRPVSWAMEGLAAASRPLAGMLEQGELPPCCERAKSVNDVIIVEDRAEICGGCPIAGACEDGQSLCAPITHDGRTYGYLAAAVEGRLDVDDEELSLFEEMNGDFAYALAGIRTEAERRNLESQLNHAQKIEAVGRLAGGVAHDYNNMLSVISGYAELALSRTGADDPLREDLRQIVEAARRSADITRQLLAFARKQTIRPEVLDLNATVEGMLRMLRRLIGEDIDLVWQPGFELWPVKLDPSQLDQILANLCVNARDAIDGVGKITIETANVDIDEEYCRDHAGFRAGAYVLLAVSDDGHGMDEETVANAFEPFFTTKGVGRGTGLGLSTVFGIVKQNDGFVNVYSELGHGTSMKVYLPRHVGDHGAAVDRRQPAPAPASGGETVLVVEDEPLVLKLVATMLERLGYAVLPAASPSEAIALAESNAEMIHLLITDVVMPEMTGRELAGRLLALHPGLEALFMSGYTANVIAHRGILDEGVHFIQKPFSHSDLAAKVRQMLDASGAS